MWRVLRNRNYALLFWGQLISSLGTQMQVVAIAWQVYLLTHSALALGLIGLFEGVPRLLFSLVGGVSADAFDRRKLMQAIQAVLALLSMVLALCTFFHVITLAIIYAVVLLSSSASAFSYPTRQAIIPTLVPREQMSDALSLSLLMGQLASIAGPAAGGFLIAVIGIASTYWMDVLSYSVVITALLFMLVPRIPSEKRVQPGFGALAESLRFLKTHSIILSVITLDFFAVLFGSPFSLLPIFASAILHVGSRGLGIMLAADSIGAFALTPFAGHIGRIARQGLGIVLAIVAWGICVIAFGLFPISLWLAALFLAGAGAANIVSTILRFHVILLVTPDEFRGRVNSVNAMFAFGGNQFGQLESGLVANFAGPQFAVVSGGIACILLTLIIVALVPKVLHVQINEELR